MADQTTTNGANTDEIAPIPKSGASPYAWYSLAVLTLLCFFSYMDRLAPAILLQAIKADLKVSDQMLGLVTGLAFAIFYTAAGLPLARLADRSSRVRLVSVSLALWSVMTTASGTAQNFIQLCLARMGVGIGEAACLPAAHSILGDLFPRHQRALAISIFQTGTSLGASVGVVIVGILGERFGWRVAFQFIGLAGLPLVLLILFTAREPKRSDVTVAAARESTGTVLRALASRRAYVHLVIAYGLGTICVYGFGQWIPAFLIRSFGMSMIEVGAYSGAAQAIGGIPGLLGGGMFATWMVRRDARWELWIPALAYLIITPSYVLMFLSTSPAMAVMAKTSADFFIAAGGGVALAAGQTFSESHRRATAVSIMIAVSSILGLGVGPYIVGLFSDLLAPAYGKESLRYAMLITCFFLLWAAWHFFLAARSLTRDRVD